MHVDVGGKYGITLLFVVRQSAIAAAADGIQLLNNSCDGHNFLTIRLLNEAAAGCLITSIICGF